MAAGCKAAGMHAGFVACGPVLRIDAGDRTACVCWRSCTKRHQLVDRARCQAAPPLPSSSPWVACFCFHGPWFCAQLRRTGAPRSRGPSRVRRGFCVFTGHGCSQLHPDAVPAASPGFPAWPLTSLPLAEVRRNSTISKFVPQAKTGIEAEDPGDTYRNVLSTVIASLRTELLPKKSSALVAPRVRLRRRCICWRHEPMLCGV